VDDYDLRQRPNFATKGTQDTKEPLEPEPSRNFVSLVVHEFSTPPNAASTFA
jgi:hypothetical protein